MFTVNVMDEAGVETLLDGVASVQRQPAGTGDFPDTGGVQVQFSDGSLTFYPHSRSGDTSSAQPSVFVMNESGKTVARYAL